VVLTELDQPTTARALAFADGSDQALLSAMRSNMPRGGITEGKLGARRAMQPASYRLLDNRILENALGFLDDDISAAFLGGLSKYRALTKAARDSIADPKHSEVMVTLIDPYQITSTQKPYIALVADDSEITRITFEISFVFGMFQTAVVIRRGAIESVESETCSLGVTLSLEGWQPPLLKRDLQLRVRLPVRPPISIPLPPNAQHRR
jgi:hypothetical protein